MTDRDSPVTEHELHAYVDGELPADRRGAVQAWLASHPEDTARVAQWRAQAEAIRLRYGAIAAEPVAARFNLDKLARGARSWRAMAAAAIVAAFLAGGVVGWMAHGASAAAPSRFDTFTTQALDAHRVYVVEVRHPVEVSGAERPHLVQWLSKRLDYELRIPDAIRDLTGGNAFLVCELWGDACCRGHSARPRSACMKDRPASASPFIMLAPIRHRPPCATGRAIAFPRYTGWSAGSPMW